MSSEDLVECDCELETITMFIHKELVSKHGFRAIQRSKKLPPGHASHFDELRQGEIFPDEWREQFPGMVEILYRSERHPKGHFKLQGSVNEVSTHTSSMHGYLDGCSDSTSPVRKATFVLSCHIHDSEFKYHLESDAKSDSSRNPYMAVKEVSIALPIVKYISSFVEKPKQPEEAGGTALLVPHHLHSTKSNEPKKFHIVKSKEEKLSTIITSIASDICDLRELPVDIKPIDQSKHTKEEK